jgi:CRP-like cAMP-binding protein
VIRAIIQEPFGFFRALEAEQLSEVLGAAKTMHAAVGQVLTQQGGKAEHFFFIRTGAVKSCHLEPDGKEVRLYVGYPGDVFGLVNLLERPTPYVCTITAARDSELLAWDQAEIRRLAHKYRVLVSNGFEIVMRYLNETFERVTDMATASAPQRLRRRLLRMAASGKPTAHGVEILITNEELAAETQLTPWTISRELRRWARSGALTKKRGRLYLRPEKLLIAH